MHRKRTALLCAIALAAIVALVATRGANRGQRVAAVRGALPVSPDLALHPERDLACPTADHVRVHLTLNPQPLVEELAANPVEAASESVDAWYPGLPFNGVELHQLELNTAAASVVADGAAILKISIAKVGGGWAASDFIGCNSVLAQYAKSFG